MQRLTSILVHHALWLASLWYPIANITHIMGKSLVLSTKKFKITFWSLKFHQFPIEKTSQIKSIIYDVFFLIFSQIPKWFSTLWTHICHHPTPITLYHSVHKILPNIKSTIKNLKNLEMNGINKMLTKYL